MSDAATLARPDPHAAPEAPPLRVMILGAAGRLGRLLSARLAREAQLGGRPVGALDLVDIERPLAPVDSNLEVTARPLDLTARDAVKALAALKPDVIFHLAAAVPSEADADFARGYRGNVIATWALLDALRHLRHAPVFVFGSTTAVFGPPLPDQVPDAQAPVPQSSYGTQKAMAELLIADHGRHGYIDPISLRLPIVAGCPSAPSAAVARFVSDMICEPLAGRTADVPVPLDTRLWIASPEAVVADLLHAAALPADIRGRHRVLATPGLAVTPAQIVAALREVAGTDVAERVRSAPDAEVTRIVASWPGAMSCSAARALRFPADRGLRALILAQIAAQES